MIDVDKKITLFDLIQEEIKQYNEKKASEKHMDPKETLLQIKQQSNEDHIRKMAHQAYIDPIQMLDLEMRDRLAAKNNDIDRLLIFKETIYTIASTRWESPDDYIRVAKQAIDDYEKTKR